MSLKKTLAIVTAAASLAAISVPVMAFENEIHGTSRLRLFFSNYEQGGGGNPLGLNSSGYVALPAGNSSANLKTNNYFEQRSRLFYTAKASDDLKLVTAFEIDSVFGDRSQSGTTYGPLAGASGANASTAGPTATTNNVAGNAAGATGRNQGGGLESDTVNLETKWVYIDFKIPSTTTRISAGIQPVKDQIKGVFFDADVAGVMSNSTFDGVKVQTGYFRGYDKTYFTYSNKSQPKGMDTLTIGALQTQFALSKDANLGFAYYIYDDSRGQVNAAPTAPFTTPAATANYFGSDMQVNVLALTGDAKFGGLTLSGFAAYQGGIIKDFVPQTATATINGGAKSAYLNAYALNAAAKMAAGPGTFKTAYLYTSGNNNSDVSTGHLKGWIGTCQSSDNVWASTACTSTYNESGMMLLNRNAAAGTGTTDYALAYNTGNGTSPATMQGMHLYTLGYDATITPKVYLNTNLGFLWAAKNNSLKPNDFANAGTNKKNASNFMGSELNVEAGYKMYDNLTLSLQAAYVMLGGYYKNSSAASFTNSTGLHAETPENPYTVRTSLIFNF